MILSDIEDMVKWVRWKEEISKMACGKSKELRKETWKETVSLIKLLIDIRIELLLAELTSPQRQK